MPTGAKRPLAGKLVMVTRPAHQAEPLCQLLEQNGASVLRFPVIEITDASDQPALLDVLRRLEQFDMAIFISPNAVSRIMNLLHTHKMHLPEELTLATIGKGSARELKSFTGRAPDIVPASVFNSEALLEMEAMAPVSGKKIVIFRGEGGRELLAETLRERGANVEYADAYRRINAQMPLTRKIEFADFVIDNNGSPDHTRKEVERVYGELRKLVGSGD